MQVYQPLLPQPLQDAPVVQLGRYAQQSQQRVRVGVYSQQLSTPELPQHRPPP
jgi:hypothetical protein